MKKVPSAYPEEAARQRGRPERPVDPDAGPVQRFASELRALRAEAGSPSYRTMAERTGVSVSALSRAASGERLPSAAVARAYAQACGADPEVWEARWRAAGDVRECATESDPPYRGLAPFGYDDRALFCGRERAVEEAVRLALEKRFAVLTGPSGNGKSSLLRAGVLPALRAQLPDARVHLITPGSKPSTTHAQLLAPRPGGPERLVVVDRFEEIFTLCRSRAERWGFVDQLLAAGRPGERLRVVVAVGAVFHHRCAPHTALAEALRDSAYVVGPPDRQELRDAVVGPATAMGLRVEKALTARIVEDVAGRPAALPVLSHALRETWRRRRSGVLTLAAYEEAGGVQQMFCDAAEEFYLGLSPTHAGTARRILLALVAPGEGRSDGCRPMARTDLCEWPDPEVTTVLTMLVRARLVTVDHEKAQLAHEALLTGWPRLRRWIDENHLRMHAHRRLAEDAQAWYAGGRDPGSLYRGRRLLVADALFTRDRRDADLSCVERAFLGASRVAHRMERWGADRMKARFRSLLLTLSMVMVGALLTGAVAWRQSDQVERQSLWTDARQAADAADRARLTDPRTAALLSVAAWRLAPLPESRAALFDALTDPELDVFTAPYQTDRDQEFLTASGRELLVTGGGRWTSWDVRGHRRTGSGPLPDAQVTVAGADGRRLALASGTGGADQLWRPEGSARSATGQVMEFGTGSYVTLDPDGGLRLRATDDDRVLFTATEADTLVPSPDGRLVAVCTAGLPPALWDLVRSRELKGDWNSAPAPACSPGSLALDPAGARLAAVTDAGVRVWDTATGRRLAEVARPDGRRLLLTRDRRFLAVAGADDVTVWRLAAPEAPVFRHPLSDGPVTALALDPGAPVLRYLAEGAVHSLDLRAPLTAAWQEAPAGRQLLSPDGRSRVTVDTAGRRFRLGDTDLPAFPGTDAPATGVPLMAFSPDNRYLAYGVAAASFSKFSLWDVRAHRRQATLSLPSATGVRSIALTPYGRRLLISRVTASGTSAGEVWDTALKTLTSDPDAWADALKESLAAGFSGPSTALPHGWNPGVSLGRRHGDTPDAVALSPGGAHLATGDAFGTVTVWDGVGVRYRSAVLPGAPAVAGCGSCSRVTALAFGPDGRTLVASYGSGALRLWDVVTRRPLGGVLATSGGTVRSLAFGGDGGTVYAGADHLPVQRYVIAPRLVAALLCRRAGSSLSGAQWRDHLPDVPYLETCHGMP